MRVSCVFVTIAILLAEQSNALPILGVVDLPVLTNTLDRVSLTKDLSSNLLENENAGGLISTNELIGSDHGLINTNGALEPITVSLRRRQGLQLVNTVGHAVKGLEGHSLLGGIETISPVTHGLGSKIGSLNGALPDVKNVVGGTTQVLSTSYLHEKLPSIIKRAIGSEIASMPMMQSLPVVDAIPLTKIDDLLSELGVSNLVKRDVGLGSLPMLGSLPGIGGLTSMPSIPGMSSIPGMRSSSQFPGMGALSSIPGMSSLTNIPAMPSMPSIPGVGSLTSLPGAANAASIPGIDAFQSLSSVGMSRLSSLGL